MDEKEKLENLKLIDKNIRNSSPLRDWWCDKCGRKLLYPGDKPAPQCPYCYSSQGLVVRMRQYFVMPGIGKGALL